MNSKKLEKTIRYIEKLQLHLYRKRFDYHGYPPKDKLDDIRQLQTSIEIIKNLIIEPDYIWQKKKDL